MLDNRTVPVVAGHDHGHRPRPGARLRARRGPARRRRALRRGAAARGPDRRAPIPRGCSAAAAAGTSPCRAASTTRSSRRSPRWPRRRKGPLDARSADLQRHLLSVLLLWIERWYDGEHTERRDGNDAALELYRRFSRVLERDFAAHHDAGHYADALAMPPAALSHALSQVVGRSTKELVTDRVMMEAARLLTFTDRTVGEVAFQTGFSDPLYFSRAFKRHTGEPPTAFRDRYARRRAGLIRPAATASTRCPCIRDIEPWNIAIAKRRLVDMSTTTTPTEEIAPTLPDTLRLGPTHLSRVAPRRLDRLLRALARPAGPRARRWAPRRSAPAARTCSC